MRPRSQTAVATQAKATVASKKGIEIDTESSSSNTRPPSASTAGTTQSADETKGYLNRYFEHKVEQLRGYDTERLETSLKNTLNVRNRSGVYENSFKYDFKDFLLHKKINNSE